MVTTTASTGYSLGGTGPYDAGQQLSFLSDESSLREEPGFLSEQLITCIGNKRALLNQIGVAVAKVKERIGNSHLRTLDAFSGSGVVSRYFKGHSSVLISNDIEDYACVVGRCYLSNRNEVDLDGLCATVRRLNEHVDKCSGGVGLIEELYAPKDEDSITADDRVFYTRKNARRLDCYRKLIDLQPQPFRDLLLGPLLSEASVHANTAGVFKGFYKDRETGFGRFGGTKADALARIKGHIRLEAPVLSRFDCQIVVCQEDANTLVKKVQNLDLAYFDPPYNQHPYGSNYFMLNLLVGYQRPNQMSRVSGIPVDWRRSDYNVRSLSLPRFSELIREVDAKFVLVSFNDEGFIRPEEMRRMLESIGTIDEIQIPYNAFRGSRNLQGRDIHVVEHLFLVERR